MQVKSSQKGKIIPKKATSFKQKTKPILEDDEWAVYTDDQNIQNGISEFLSEKGYGPNTTGEITYNGKERPVFFVPFFVIEFLKKNKSKFPNYIPFHRRKRVGSFGSSNQYGLWRVWMEGEKTPSAFLKKFFENWGKNG